jgi:1,2-diacylglycerol 3-alpha-glucosyltransferase
MKLGIVTNWNHSGAGEVGKLFAEYFISNGHSVSIYARPEPGRRLNIDDTDFKGRLEVYFGKATPNPTVKSLDSRDFNSWLNNGSFDVIVFNEQHSFLEVERVKKKGIKTAAYVDYYREDTIDFFAIYDLLICVTRRHFSVFSWHQGAKYIPWGIRPSIFTNAICTREFDFFHSCGNDPYRKGTDILVKSLIPLTNTRTLIHTQTDLFKSIPSVSEELASLIEAGRLTVIQEDIAPPGLYGQGKIYAYPARLDGLGLTICEALASGLPVVTTDNGPMNEFLSPQVGVTVPISKSWSRSDGYYWPLVEVAAEDFSMALNQTLVNYNKGLLQSVDCVSYINQNRNLEKNFRELNSSITKLEFNDTLNDSLTYRIKTSPSSKFLIRYRFVYGILFRLKRLRYFFSPRKKDV